MDFCLRGALSLLLVLPMGCGNIGYDALPRDGGTMDDGGPSGRPPDTGLPDGGRSDGGLLDAGAPDGGTPDGGTPDGGRAGPCQWGEPVPVPGVLDTAGDYQPTLTDDGLRMCFTSNRGDGNIDIYCTERAGPTADWEAPAEQSDLSATGADRMPALSADGSELFFVSNRLGDDDIFRATWHAGRREYVLDGLVDELATPEDETGPELSADGLTLYFDRPVAGGGVGIHTTTRPSVGMAFGPVTELTSINGGGDASEAALSNDGSLMVFCTHRSTPGAVSPTLHCSRREGALWGTPEPVDALGFDMFAACSPALGPAGELYYNTTIASGPGGSDIVEALPP